MMPKEKEIPFNCKICKHLIEHYYTGELICDFEDGVNPDLISDCDEFKIGKLKLIEFLQERDKRIEALEKNVKGIIERLDTHNNEGHERFKEIKAIESTLLKIFNTFSQKYADGWSEDTLYVKLIEIEYDLKKQLDGKQ